jgi:hypothetical protein
MNEQVDISPIVISRSAGNGGDGEAYYTIPLTQLTAGSPVQILNLPPAPPATDSSCIALQFFYGDPAQPEAVDITILAVDKYSLAAKSGNINNVHDTMKAVVSERTLHKGELSEMAVLNLYQFKHSVATRVDAARFFYRITKLNGDILQDYPAKADSNSPEIKPEPSKTIKTRPVYKSAIMQFKYGSNRPFNSPEPLLYGEKW